MAAARALLLLLLGRAWRGEAAVACTAARTSNCCGDSVCDGPETAANCAADCSGSGNTGNTGNNGNTGGSCTTVPSEKPTVPTECTTQNQGCCECGSVNIKTFVFWLGDAQRCFHTWNMPSSPPAGGPNPVVLHMDGYSGGRKGSEVGGDMEAAADKYGFTVFKLGNLLKDGAGDFGLQFGNNNIANDANPTPCSSNESREIAYLEKVFDFIAGKSTLLNGGRVYTEGFSQNSMFAIYTAVCFSDKVAGTWQGGSGMSKTAHTPVTPGFQGQCSLSSFLAHGSQCCAQDFCTECQYWPLYPRTCNNKVLVDCIMAYTDDTIACGSDWYMYEAMRAEGHDARLLSFPGDMASGSPGGHQDPKNKWSWLVGCLGLTEACSSACETSFGSCVDAAADATEHEKFKACEGKIEAGELAGCARACAPTLAMLRRSESPVVTLSEGKFGTTTGLAKASGPADKPSCKKPFGKFSEAASQTCAAPGSFVLKAESPAECSSTPNSPGTTGGSGTTGSPGTTTQGTSGQAGAGDASGATRRRSAFAARFAAAGLLWALA